MNGATQYPIKGTSITIFKIKRRKYNYEYGWKTIIALQLLVCFLFFRGKNVIDIFWVGPWRVQTPKNKHKKLEGHKSAPNGPGGSQNSNAI